MTSIDRLLELASSPLDSGEPSADLRRGPRGEELYSLLATRNGFYAFESALHVFPSGSVKGAMSLERWNARDLWIDSYGPLAEDCLFFAEDLFGGQFCISDDKICTFDPEVGDIEPIAENLNDWASILLDDFEVLTGYPLAHQWQMEHGALTPGYRLLPKKPFVLGGEFTADNLYLLEAVEGMCFRGELAQQIADLPDGASIEIDFTE